MNKLTKRQKHATQAVEAWIQEALRRGVSTAAMKNELRCMLEMLDEGSYLTTISMYNALPEAFKTCFKQRNDGTFVRETRADTASMYMFVFGDKGRYHHDWVNRCADPAPECIAWLYNRCKSHGFLTHKPR